MIGLGLDYNGVGEGPLQKFATNDSNHLSRNVKIMRLALRMIVWDETDPEVFTARDPKRLYEDWA